MKTLQITLPASQDLNAIDVSSLNQTLKELRTSLIV